ncbi:MAG: ATP-binding protein [Thermodesulfovibrionales bacterium]|nr:ATP-binding protein [Thermodesulfovibrionales bacterium]
MAKDALINRLKTLTAFRALFVTVLLGTFFVFDIGYSIFPYPHQVLYLIIFLYALTIAYSLMLLRIGTPVFAYAQLSIDVLSAIALIFLTGGIESWFSSILLLIVIAAAIILNKRAGYIMATLSSVFYGSLVDFQYYGLLPIPFNPMLTERDFLYNIFSHIFALYLTAYLTGYLSSRLERVTNRLEKKATDLRDLALFNKDVIEGMPSGLFTAEPGGKVLLFNRAAETITGIERAAALGRNISGILPFIDRLEEAQRIEGAVVSQGKNKVIGLTVSKMHDASGMSTGFIGIFNDLTELKKMQEEIKQKERLADIGELSANIAHEIRNPLASLKGSIEMLREDTLPAGHKEKLMEIALAEMNRLNIIITDFLSYSRPGAPEPVVFDLNQMLDEAVGMFEQMEAQGVSFERKFSGRLEIKADPQRLQQVFWNLGINAIEAMPDGGSLTIGTTNGRETVEVSFEDTGTGISPENAKKVFYPFFTTKNKGTGLGLSIAYRIIEDHGGKITFQRRSGGGMKFKILLYKDGIKEAT